ncbi:MAG: hypothetical protein RIC55_30430 [Pirellulaceae bacterium]
MTASLGQYDASSKLQTLRGQLAALRRARQTVRWVTAWSALATAVLWILAAFFLLDLAFEMSVVQRVIVLLLAAVGVVLVFGWLVRPLLGRSESEIDLALLVEREQGIDSDLVAALQFESPDAQSWGSKHLTVAVIDYVAQLGRGLDVFSGFSRAVMARRATLLLATVAVIGGLALWRPEYAAVFLERLLLGARHYPTATTIEKVLVNDAVVLREQSSPIATRGAEGRPLVFTVLCSGQLPEQEAVREIHLSSAGVGRHDAAQLELRRLTQQQRLDQLREVENELQSALTGNVDIHSPAWIEHVAALAHCDAPSAAALIEQAEGRTVQLEKALASVRKTAGNFAEESAGAAVYRATMAQMVDSLDYTIQLNDAWTDSARISLIAQPVVAMQLTPKPPEYARDSDVAAPVGARQISVLQGSDVEVDVRAVTSKGQTKQLQEVWLTVLRDPPRRFALKPHRDNEGEVWRLPAEGSPLVDIQTETRFEVQATDADGLHLAQPLSGYIRLKADRAPTGTAKLVSHVVLPTAKPVVSWRGVTDDYGVSHVRLHVDVFRQGEPSYSPLNESGDGASEAGGDAQAANTASETGDDVAPDQPSQSPAATVEAEGPPKDRRTYELLDRLVTAAGLPLEGEYVLDLAPLELQKGDALNVILEVVDDRGEAPGVAFLADPLPIEVSDESGVKLAVLEPDERAEQQLDEITNELLEAGDSP